MADFEAGFHFVFLYKKELHFVYPYKLSSLTGTKNAYDYKEYILNYIFSSLQDILSHKI